MVIHIQGTLLSFVANKAVLRLRTVYLDQGIVINSELSLGARINILKRNPQTFNVGLETYHGSIESHPRLDLVGLTCSDAVLELFHELGPHVCARKNHMNFPTWYKSACQQCPSQKDDGITE